MALGWLRRLVGRNGERTELVELAETRAELEELRAFAGEMEVVLEQVDALLDLDEPEIVVADHWQADYTEHDWRSQPTMRSIRMRQRPTPITMGAPQVVVNEDIDYRRHHSVLLMHSVLIDHREIMLRRTPGEVREFAEKIQSRVGEALASHALNPANRGKILADSISGYRRI